MSSRRTSSGDSPCESLKTESSSSHSRTARVPSAVTRFRKISRTRGIRSTPIRSMVASAWRARAPPTPPMSRYASRVRSRSLAIAPLPQPGCGEGQHRQRPALALDLGRASHPRDRRPRSGSRTAGRVGRGRGGGGRRWADREGEIGENRGRSGSWRLQAIRKSSRMDSTTWTSASRRAGRGARRTGAALGRVEGEELLELVDDEKSLLVAARQLVNAEIVASSSRCERAEGLGVALERRHHRAAQRGTAVVPGVQETMAQSLDAFGISPAWRNDDLPGTGGSDQTEQACGPSSLRHMDSTSASRPKKYSASASVKEARPG